MVEDYSTGELGETKIQAYADDMVLVSNSEKNLHSLIINVKNFLDFANVRLNPGKCEVMIINSETGHEEIGINDIRKEYIAKNSFIKYLIIRLGSRKINKTKFIETKINKLKEELDKLEYSGLAFNQMLKVIKSSITNKLYCIFANMNIPKKYLELVDQK
jgi:hypothetical protein